MQAPRDTTDRTTIIAYSLPAMPLAAMYFPVFVFLSEFYASARTLDLAALGAVLLAVRLFDAVSDPVVGYLSDRSPARLGRRKLWLIFSTPVVMLATWQLFVPPEAANLAWFSVWLFVLTFGWTLAMTPYFAWGAELTGDYAERSRVTIWRESLGLVGTILAALLYGLGEGPEDGLKQVAFFVCLVLPLAVFICWHRVAEPKDFSANAPQLGDVIAIMRRQPIFRRLILAYFINGAANGIAATLFIFFVSYRLLEPDMGGPLLIVYFGAAVLAAPFWGWATRRWSKHRVWCVAMIYAGLIFIWTIALGPGGWPAFAVICVLSGAALGADLALPSAIQADLVDIATEESGAQQTGAFFALWSVATKLALAVSGGASLIYLGWVGFDVSAENDQSALTALSLLYGLGPIGFKLIAVAMMWNFPLGAAQQAQTRRLIEARTQAS